MISLRRLGLRRNRLLVCITVLILFGIMTYFRDGDDTKESLPGVQGKRRVNERSDLLNEHDRKVQAFRRARYENYKNVEPSARGPGEQGTVCRLEGEKASAGKEAYKQDGFNFVCSDEIALNRSLPDLRSEECRNVQYPSQLPTASVVIIFHNEYRSAILRTVVSVVNRSPHNLLQEVLLVDDASTKPELLRPLDDFVSSTWPDGIVRIVRIPKRSGLIQAKIFGGREAVGDVIIFLDAHCEATKGWLEPLVGRIKEAPNAVLVPTIAMIGANDMGVMSGGSGAVGGFSWGLHFTWMPMPAHERQRRKSSTETIRSPTMPGGLLAMRREFYIQVGEYDPGMEIWGGENLEMSFRVWMCGGTLEFVPCSHVGHIFRATHPYGFPSKTRDYHGLNSKRLAEVWMDSYKRLFYLQRHELATADAGDYSDRIALRKSLKCHDFKWYLDNVYPEKFVFDENVIAYGKLRNPSTGLCLDTLGKKENTRIPMGVFNCQPSSMSEIVAYTKTLQIRREEACLDSGFRENDVYLAQCHGDGGAQSWHHEKSTGIITSAVSGMCLDADGLRPGDTIQLGECETNKLSQQWEFENYT